jgi:DNA-binding transcriptional LysR family regulator
MTSVDISRIDLNLLVVVATVLEERSATRAGARLHVTQSAISSALRRAREVFRDPLVVRRAHGLTPTVRGASLLPELRAWIEGARRIVSDPHGFDAARTARTFTLACTDAITLVVLPRLVRALEHAAPNAKLRILTLDRLLSDDALERGDCDLLVGIPPVVPPLHHVESVYEDRLVTIVRRDHPVVRRKLSLDAFTSLPHAELALFGRNDDAIDVALARCGRARTVKYALPHFSALPLVVTETDAIATVGQRVALALAHGHAIRWVETPLPLAPIAIRQVWHERAASDPGVAFLRALVRKAAQAGGRSRSGALPKKSVLPSVTPL